MIESALKELEDWGPGGWFARQPPLFRRTVAKEARIVTIERGAWLYGAEDEAHGLFAVLEGGVRIYYGADAPVLVDLFQPGEWFGQAGLLPAARRAVTATAAAETRLLLVPRSAFRRLVRDAPEMWMCFAELDRTHLEKLLRVQSERAPRSPLAAVAGRLAGMARVRRSSGEIAPVWLSQSEVAELVGLERKAAHRALAQLEAAGAVQLGYRRLDILSAGKLRSYAKGEK